jgi:transcriptional regulator with XRE-family HTH domain
VNILDEYLIKRRQKKIPMREIAKHIGCSQSLLSRFETGSCTMCYLKVEKYRTYIDSN